MYSRCDLAGWWQELVSKHTPRRVLTCVVNDSTARIVPTLRQRSVILLRHWEEMLPAIPRSVVYKEDDAVTLDVGGWVVSLLLLCPLPQQHGDFGVGRTTTREDTHSKGVGAPCYGLPALDRPKSLLLLRRHFASHALRSRKPTTMHM